MFVYLRKSLCVMRCGRRSWSNLNINIHEAFAPATVQNRMLLTSQRTVLCTYRSFFPWSNDEGQKLMTTKREESCRKYGRFIYEGPINFNVKLVKSFSLSTSLVAIAAQPWIWKDVLLAGSSAPMFMPAVVGSLLSSIMIFTPLAFNILTKRYVREIYYDKDTETYTAYTFTLILRDRIFSFKQADIVPLEEGSLVSTMHIQKRPYFIVAGGFIRPDDHSAFVDVVINISKKRNRTN